MKNHEYRNGKLIQTNKKFLQLKQKQKEWINSLLKNKYKAVFIENGKRPSKQVRESILQEVYGAVEEKEMWIPYYEVERFFYSKIFDYESKIRKEHS
ncbi:hypothetical protein [Peribacillus asahii]|uniref:hypothetical protein n=1 Tax=Peribacillus asahii TaxID=228899 RepID=UPI00207A5647|nr:hypothetical protein [Peribacillus asahii]USK72228.1 hypothetical protein LIS76_10975 [Peribacillus asahii]